MNNYKIKVNDEAESKEAQELFFELGYAIGVVSYEQFPVLVIAHNCGYGPVSTTAIYMNHENHKYYTELTLPQLRDLVAQSKSKSIEFLEPQNDGTYKLINWTCMSHPPKNFIEVPDGAELYVYWPVNNDHNFQSGGSFYEDGIWNPCSFSVEEIKTGDAGAKILWSRETIQEKGLISGADAKLAWAKGEALQIRETGTNEWKPLTDKYTLMVFDYDRYELRIKPRTIKLNLEIPAPFEPKPGEEYFYIQSCRNGYARSRFNSEHCDQHLVALGAWRTEEEIKQVVTALRGGIKG